MTIENRLDQSVREIMTKKVLSVDVSERIMDVQHLLITKHIRHAPVMQDGLLVGILSLTDLQRMNFTSTYGDEESAADDAISNLFTAGMVMHKDPITVSPDSNVAETAKIFVEKEFHALPVVENDHLIGIVTTTDILKMLVL